MKKALFSSLTILLTFALFAQEVGKPLPPWKESEMEIHHIYTGRGVGVFCILPDGTTLLIDAGDAGPYIDPKTTHVSPDDSRQAGEWIARYIINRMDFKKNKKIDYAFLTHFHYDHMGGLWDDSPKTAKGGNYYLSGLSEVNEYVPFNKIIDRDWPSYHYPKPQESKRFDNYRNFIDWNIKNNGMKMERFVPGINSQFVLVNHPELYKGKFEVQNIVSNGEVWSGQGTETRNFFPEENSVDENNCSAGIRLTYGDFDYFNGADLHGRLSLNDEEWHDIETPVGAVVGPVEVCQANHHACVNSMTENFLSSVKPQIVVIQVWHEGHLISSVIERMSDKGLNPNIKHIIPTNIPEISKAKLGDELFKKLTGEGAHVLIKIAQGGKQYSVILLTTEDESYRVKEVYGPYDCI